jgi:hypothetical protein
MDNRKVLTDARNPLPPMLLPGAAAADAPAATEPVRYAGGRGYITPEEYKARRQAILNAM